MQEGDDPNCFNSDDGDFRIVKECDDFDLVRVQREGFAKTFTL